MNRVVLDQNLDRREGGRTGGIGQEPIERVGFGIDPIEELTNLAERVRQDFPHSMFFTSKLIFEHDNWYIRQLHSEAALTMLRRLHLLNMPMVVLPMRL